MTTGLGDHPRRDLRSRMRLGGTQAVSQDTMSSAACGASTVRQDAVAAAIGAWAVIGLMLDGRSHETGAVESFFTPWHGVLYSGVAAAMIALALLATQGRRAGRAGSIRVPAAYGLAVVGTAVMAVAGMADMAWHAIFGIEEDLAALLSPTHLLLLIGGLLLLSSPVRAARMRPGTHVGWAALGPAIVAAMLTATTVGFFVEFASPFHDADVFAGGGEHGSAELGVAGVLITTVLLAGTLVVLLERFGRLPFGSATVIFTGLASLLSLAADFAVGGAVAAAIVGGVAADVILRDRVLGARERLPLAMALVPVPLWLAFYAVVAGSLRLTWDAEIWSGSIVLAAVAGYGVGLLAIGGGRRAVRPR